MTFFPSFFQCYALKSVDDDLFSLSHGHNYRFSFRLKISNLKYLKKRVKRMLDFVFLSQFYYKQTRLDFQTSSPFHSFKHEDHVYGELDFAITIIIVAALRHGLKRNSKRIRMWRFLLWNDLDTNWWFALTTDHRIFFLNADSDASRYRLYSKNSYTRLKAKILIVIQTLLE